MELTLKKYTLKKLWKDYYTAKQIKLIFLIIHMMMNNTKSL